MLKIKMKYFIAFILIVPFLVSTDKCSVGIGDTKKTD